MVHSTRLVSAEEFARIPDDDCRYELVHGRVIRMSPPGFRHGKTAGAVFALLHAHVAAHRLGVVLVETGFKLASNPDTVRGPHVSFVRSEQLATGEPPGFWEGPPDLAVEIRSPDDRPSEIADRVSEYLRHGVRLVWVVDSDQHTVTSHRPSVAPSTVGVGERLDAGDVVPGFSCEVGPIFD